MFDVIDWSVVLEYVYKLGNSKCRNFSKEPCGESCKRLCIISINAELAMKLRKYSLDPFSGSSKHRRLCSVIFLISP